MDQSRCKYWIRSNRSLTNVTQQLPKAALGRSRRFGRTRDFRSAPVNGHSQDRRVCLKGANSRLDVAAMHGP